MAGPLCVTHLVWEWIMYKSNGNGQKKLAHFYWILLPIFDSQVSCEQAKKMISLGVQRDSQDKLEKATYLHECFLNKLNIHMQDILKQQKDMYKLNFAFRHIEILAAHNMASTLRWNNTKVQTYMLSSSC
jgi:hypothetical protein